MSDGARSQLTGDVDLGALARADLPDQVARSTFPTQKSIFFAARDVRGCPAQGDFTGTFHLFKGGPRAEGHVRQRRWPGVNDWRFPNLRGSRAVGAAIGSK